jgi:UDP-N-acetylmuramoylalanine--D-glutamate ligase
MKNYSQIFAFLPKPIAIVGLGISGESTNALLQFCGVPRSEIILFDAKSAGSDYQDPAKMVAEKAPKTLVVSPGVPLSSEWIQKEKNKGTLITSELNLAYELLENEKIIAITGSIGKSTTTCLIGEGLNSYLPETFVGGNLGTPLAQYALERVSNQRPPATWLVLELSSYQLENFSKLKAEYSVFTYFTANHLERYPDKNTYYATKWTLLNQTLKTVVFNNNGGELTDWLQAHPASLPHHFADRNSKLMQKYNLANCALLGSHNLDNIAVAAQVLELLSAPTTAFQKLCEFRGLAHRVENLGIHNGVRYVNDSKATTIESVITAVNSTLESVPSNKILWLLIGGRDKNLPWQDLQVLRQKSNLNFVFFGECADKAKALSNLPGNSFPELKPAVESLRGVVASGDTVLLSPGGTSLDEFKNFEDRGNQYKAFCFL